MRALQHKRQGIEPGAVRHRRRQEMRVALVEGVDVGVVALAHEDEVAVAQHRAFRPAGGARGVEEPGAVGRQARLGAKRRCARQQRVIGSGAGRDHRVQAVDGAGERRERLGEAGGGDEQPGARVPGDIFDLARVQPGIGRHGAEPGCPAAEHQLEELAAIFKGEQHPVARHEAARPEPAGHSGDALGEFAIVPGMPVVADRRPLRQPARHIEQQRSQVHRSALIRRGWASCCHRARVHRPGRAGPGGAADIPAPADIGGAAGTAAPADTGVAADIAAPADIGEPSDTARAPIPAQHRIRPGRTGR
jgi:hypothetical protein